MPGHREAAHNNRLQRTALRAAAEPLHVGRALPSFITNHTLLSTTKRRDNMRAVFTVQISAVSVDKYPTNEEFLSRIRALGWEDVKVKELSEEDKLKWYEEHAEKLWENMPEIAADERDYVIFYGVLQDNQAKFIITRVTEGQATFRLLHPNLDRLQASTIGMVKKLIESVGNLQPIRISNQRISIYERGYDEIIIQGRVVPNALAEAWRVDKRNILLAIGAFLLTVPTFAGLIWVNSQTNQILGGTLERASTAFLTTFIVSVIGFLQTYLQIRNIKIVDWVVASNSEHTPQQ